MKNALKSNTWDTIGRRSGKVVDTEVELSQALRTSLSELSEQFDAILGRYKEKRAKIDKNA